MPSRPARLRYLVLSLGLLAVGAPLRAAPPLRAVIDAQLQEAWKQNRVTPARPASDSAFLRRVYLDLVGGVPTYEETVAFLDGKQADKRERLIYRLLADPRFARHQADVWDLVLFGRNPPGHDTDRRDGFRAWLQTRFEKNVPYDVWARELLRAEGNSVDNGALYYVQYSNAPEDATEAITQTFLGVQLQCARCHDHPYESWKQRDFYGMAAFLARLEVVSTGKKVNQTVYVIGEHDAGDIQFTGPAKDAAPGKKGEPVRPKFLTGATLDEPPAAGKPGRRPRFKPNQPPPRPAFSRKDRLADWITAPDNPYFARAVANRLWAQYFGRGLVHPVDNMSESNKPCLPPLLDALSRGLIEHKFDLKWLIRELVSTQAYQLSSAGSGEAMPDWYQHARTRPLSAEELAEAWRTVTGYAATEKPGKSGPPSRYRPLDGYLLSFFGTPTNGTGDFQGGLQEHLYLNNGPLGQLIAGGKDSLAAFVGDTKRPVAQRVERLFLQSLHRRPTAAEAERLTAFLDGKGQPADAVWVLLTGSEFRFNH